MFIEVMIQKLEDIQYSWLLELRVPKLSFLVFRGRHDGSQGQSYFRRKVAKVVEGLCTSTHILLMKVVVFP